MRTTVNGRRKNGGWLWRRTNDDQRDQGQQIQYTPRSKPGKRNAFPASPVQQEAVVAGLEREVNWLDEEIQELKRQIGTAVIVPPRRRRVNVKLPGNYGRLLTVSQRAESTMYLWEANSGKHLASLRGHQDIVTAIVILPGIEQRIVSGSADSTMKVWSALDGRCITTLRGHEGSISSIVVAAPGHKYIVSGSSDTTIKTWRVSDWVCLATFRGHNAPVQAVAVLPGGDRVVSFAGRSGAEEPAIKVWRNSDGRCIKTLPTGDTDMLGGIEALPGGEHILSLPQKGPPRKWSLADGQASAVLNQGSTNRRAARSAIFPGGTFMVAADPSDLDIVKIWSLADGLCIKTLHGHQSPVNALAVLPGSAFVASASVDEEIRIWRVRDGQEAVELFGHPGSVSRMIALG